MMLASPVSRCSVRSSWLEAKCELCGEGFDDNEVQVVVEMLSWHTQCFRCAQCFDPLMDGLYYRVDNKVYCQHDFDTLYAPFCYKCERIVEGVVKKALNRNFHEQCFRCEECDGPMVEGVWYMQGKMMCYNCKMKVHKEPYYPCYKCHQAIDKKDLLRFQMEYYHAYHFNCSQCDKMLTKEARELKEQLYCPRCYDLTCDVCADCKKVIDKQEEQSVIAMGKHFHVDHFRCKHCGRPFYGKKHYERNSNAYCEEDYVKLFGNYCYECLKPLSGTSVFVFGKGWCQTCYRCTTCAVVLKSSDKVADMDMRPMCKKCLRNKTFQKALKEKNESLKKMQS